MSLDELTNQFFARIKRAPFDRITLQPLDVADVKNKSLRTRLSKLPSNQSNGNRTPMLLLHGLGDHDKRVSAVRVLGAIAILFAPSGAGKTRLLYKILCDLDPDVSTQRVCLEEKWGGVC